MDFATVAIGLGVCVIAAGVLFLISIFSFKERTFEEALAEQQKLTDSLLKSDKVTKNEKEKKSKKSVKKNKEKEKTHVEVPAPSTSVASDVIQQSNGEDKSHVEFEPDPEIIPQEVAAPAPAEKEKKKTDKKEKVKPILRNRDSHSPIPPETLPVTTDDTVNHFLEHPPKDAVELKNNGTKHGGSKAGSKSAKNGAESPTEIPVVEPVTVKEVAFVCGGKSTAPVATSAAAPTTVPASTAQPTGTGTPKKQQRKKASGGKSDSLDVVDGGEELLLVLGGTEKLLSAVQRVPLSAADLQTMIEVLLNRQQEANGAVESEWMESGGRLDPLSLLRKQLAEKEKALKEEQEVSLAYQNKLKTLGAEMATERTRSAAARKQLEENSTRQSAEIQTLTMKLAQASEQYAAEMAALRNTVQHVQKTAQMSEDQTRQLQRLQEEKAQMEAHFAGAQSLQQELGSRVQQLEELLHRKEELFRIQEQQRAAQEVDVQNQMQMLAAKLQEAEQAKTTLLANQSHEAQNQIHQLRDALGLAEAQALHVARESQARFEETERTKQLLEDRITTVERDLVLERNISAQKDNEASQELARLREEIQHIQSRATNAERDLQAERESVTQKVDLSNQEITRLQQDNQALRERINAFESEMASKGTDELTCLRDEIQQLQVRLTNADRDLQAERELLAQKESESSAECARLCEENQQLKDRLATTELKSGEQGDTEELIRLREANQALTEQLASNQQAHQTAQGQLENVIKEKQDELDSQKQKNNELREKNYKAMDALTAAEKSLVELKKSVTGNPTSSEQGQQHFADLLRRVFPDLVVSASSNEDVFAQEVVAQVTASVERLTTEEQTKAQSQVQHYKTVLAQTEELLNRLQSRIEAEEQSWKSGMTKLESDVAAVQQERDFWMDQCQKQERTYQQQLQEVKEQSAPIDVSSFQSRIESLEKQIELERQTAADLTAQLNQKQQQLQTTEDSLAQERQTVQSLHQQLGQESEKNESVDLSSQLEEKQRLLQQAEESLAQEKVMVGLLREQLEQVKAEMAAAKLGSIGFMVGWSKAAHSSAALGSVAVATAANRKRHSCDNLESLLTSPVSTDPKLATTLQQVSNLTKMEAPATNGNGTAEPMSPDAEGASHFAN